MSECTGPDCSHASHETEPTVLNAQLQEDIKKAAEVAEQAAADIAQTPVVKMQHVIITLADGRRGVFMGPELIKEVEMKLGMVPQLTSVDFDPPRAIAVPIPREEVKDADKETVESKPDADSPGSVEEKA